MTPREIPGYAIPDMAALLSTSWPPTLTVPDLPAHVAEAAEAESDAEAVRGTVREATARADAAMAEADAEIARAGAAEAKAVEAAEIAPNRRAAREHDERAVNARAQAEKARGRIERERRDLATARNYLIEAEARAAEAKACALYSTAEWLRRRALRAATAAKEEAGRLRKEKTEPTPRQVSRRRALEVAEAATAARERAQNAERAAGRAEVELKRLRAAERAALDAAERGERPETPHRLALDAALKAEHRAGGARAEAIRLGREADRMRTGAILFGDAREPA